jgi:16S rRNA (guanine1207-N2)-methyltransferase
MELTLSSNKTNERGRLHEAEWALREATLEWPGDVIWMTTIGRGELARQIAAERFDAKVHCLTIDAFDAAQIPVEDSPNLTVICAPTWPDAEADMVLMPLAENGQKELARDLMQSAYQRLKSGGTLAISLNAKAESWAREQLKAFSRKIKVKLFRKTMVAWVVKDEPLKRVRDFHCELAFRDHGNLIRYCTQPGVFAHRKLDLGARQLLNAWDSVEPVRALDLGCGAGPVSLGIAARNPQSLVYAVDSNTRAIECTRKNAAQNGLTNIEAFLEYTDQFVAPNPVDLALANPPYFSNYRIAQVFCVNAHRNLRAGGQVILVTKQIQWYVENFGRWFDEVEIVESGAYHLVTGRRMGAAAASEPNDDSTR